MNRRASRDWIACLSVIVGAMLVAWIWFHVGRAVWRHW